MYSGGRDQEDGSLKPVRANSLQDLISKKKKNHKNRAGGVAHHSPVLKKKKKILGAFLVVASP
jgi:hypothetical protein